MRNTGSMRIYCVGEGSSFKHGMFLGKDAATGILGVGAHPPDSDELRTIWLQEKLYELSPQQVQERFGVTRQAVSLWRKKAGIDLPNVTEHRRAQRQDRIRSALDPAKSAAEIALEVGTTPSEVKQVAQTMGVKLAIKNKKKPSDAEIIRLSEGRTWKELADACNVTLATLRNYIYARPELSKEVCSQLLSEPTGEPSHGKIDVEELIKLYSEGLTPFKIAKRFDTQPMAVIYWLKKLDLYRGKV